MGIFDFWRQKDLQLDAGQVSDELIREASDLVVKIVGPRVSLIPGYRKRLAPAVEATIRWLRSVIESLPAVHDAAARTWATDPCVHAFFAAPEEVARSISRSEELRTFFERAPLQETALGLLGMQMTERKVLGVELHGEAIRRDAAQVTVGFSDHTVRALGGTEMELRREIGRRVFEWLGMLALQRISAAASRQQEVQQQVALLKARLRLLQKRGSAFGGATGSTAPIQNEGPDFLTRLPKLESDLEENERQLAELSARPLEHELDCLVDVLAHPEKVIVVTPRSLRLTPMNVLAQAADAEQAAEVTFSVAELFSDPPETRAFSLIRFPRAELLPGGLQIGDAQRYLG